MSVTKERKSIARAETLHFDEQIISSIVINGDISKLSPQQKVGYYRQFCERLGLDPLSQPFKLLRLNGKEIMYCDRSGAQQLNKVHKVSHEITAREIISGCYVVTAQASLPDGRKTECIGAVPIEKEDGSWEGQPGNKKFVTNGQIIPFKGDELCNAMMKAETKAKRRATLDLLGLGILDETETATLPNTQSVPLNVIEDEPMYGMDKYAPEHRDFTPAEEEGQPKKVSAFKKKYDTADEVEAMLNEAGSIQDIANLYYINAEVVEGAPELKARFTERKNDFYNTASSGNAA